MYTQLPPIFAKYSTNTITDMALTKLTQEADRLEDDTMSLNYITIFGEIAKSLLVYRNQQISIVDINCMHFTQGT